MTKAPIRFGIMLHGAGGHMNSWKHPSGPADASVNLDFYIESARKAEAAGIAFAFVADGLYINEKTIPQFLNRFEPLTILSALATQTGKIGLAGTVSTSYSDPFTVARQFASLDLISNGRAGWNVVTTPLEGSALDYSRAHPEHALRYEIADEYISRSRRACVTVGTTTPSCAIARAASSSCARSCTRSTTRTASSRSPGRSTSGSPQGQPVIFQAGSSDAGIKLAGKYADAVFAHSPSLEEKRVWTRRDLRRQGLSKRLLVVLKQQAAAQGYERFHLTAGFRQSKAKNLYLTNGYTPLFDVDGDLAAIRHLGFEKRFGAAPLDIAAE